MDFFTAGWSPICQKEMTVAVAAAFLADQSKELVFDAWKRDFDVQIKWISRTSESNDFFILEKSTDGHLFSPIKSVDGKGAPGENLYFDETDPRPARGDNFYRLLIVHHDGSSEYSGVKKVVFGNQPFSIFPNPAMEKAVIDLPDWTGKAIQIELFDQMGRSARRFVFDKLAQDGAEIDLDGLRDGLFFVRVTSEGELARTLKLVKEAGQ